MAALDLSRATWRKSTRSQANGNCVEVAEVQNVIAVRDSKNPSGPTLAFDRTDWAAFVNGIHAGDFRLS